MPMKINEEKYGISNRRYNELKNFCYQYPEWRRFLTDSKDTVKGNQIQISPHVKGQYSNPTEELAIKRLRYEKFCKMVEDTVRECSTVLYPYIIKDLTDENITFQYLKTVMEIPCSKKYYYQIIMQFFRLLDKKRDER